MCDPLDLIEIEHLDLVRFGEVLPFTGAPDRHELFLLNFSRGTIPSWVFWLFDGQRCLKLIRKTNIFT